MLNYKHILNNPSDSSTLVFIAGFTGTLETWTLCCNELNKLENYNILLIDNLGAGKSPQPNGKYSTENMAQEIIKVIKFLSINSINIIGHSLGGAIAQQIYLLDNKLVRNLIIVSSFAKIDSVCRHFLLGRYELLKEDVSKEIIALNTLPSIFSSYYLSIKNNVTFAIERIVNNTQSIAGMYGQLFACGEHNTSDILHMVNCKTTIITGSKDILVHPSHSQFLAKRIKDSILIFIPGAAHMVQLEAPAELARYIYETVK